MWNRIQAFAEERGLAPAEFVRFATLAALADESGSGLPGGRLVPLIERTFSLSYMLATKMRGEMLDGGRAEELEALIGAARGMQDELLNGVSGSESHGKGSTRRRWSEAQKRRMVGES